MTEIERLPSCDDPFDRLLPVDDARQLLLDRLRPEHVEGVEQVTLADALGRVLATPVKAAFNVPTEPNAAMDGYAVRAESIPEEGVQRLQVIGTALAGRPFSGTVGVGQAVRVFTGAVMPSDCDTVVIQEHVRVEGDAVVIDAAVVPRRNVRPAGEDVAVGDVVFERGRRLAPADIGVLASLGFARLPVRRRLRVAWFTTGDELVSLTASDLPASPTALPEAVSKGPAGTGLLYDSNRHTLGALLAQAHVDCLDFGVVADTLEATRDAFQRAAESADLVISSGGVSTGDADFVRQVFHELGEVAFWRLAMRPGRPLAFGHVGKACFFGLPGNPVAVMVTYLQFVLPALRRLAGEEGGSLRPMDFPATSLSRLKKSRGRTEFQRGIMSIDDAGQVVVESTGMQGAGRLSSMAAANCLIVIEPERERVEPGDLVRVQPFHGLFR